MNYIIYLLVNPHNNCTYIGITNNPNRRIRQHNKELVGGARYTSMYSDWKYYGWIHSIEGDLIINRALSIEKKIKIRSRKSREKMPLEKRLEAIEGLLVENPDLAFEKCLVSV